MARLVKYDFIPEQLKGLRLPKGKKAEILQEVADYLVETMLDVIGSQKSPVTGTKFKKLSKNYATFKKGEAGNKLANLELTGDLLDSLTATVVKGKVRVTVASDQQGKADGHNNFSGKSKLPPRKFIPDAKAGETFRAKAIKSGINELVSDLLDEIEE